MKELKVKLTFIEPILGTSPANPDIYREFIGSHAPDAASVEDEVAALGADAVAEKSMTIFPRLDDGTPFLYDYQIKGFFKDTCGGLRKVKDSSSSKIKAYKKEIDKLIFPEPRTIPILFDGEIKECQRPLRAQTAQGERVSLAMSEEIPAGATCEFTVVCLCDDHIAQVRYDMATQACDTRNTVQNATRDIIDANNQNSRAILDFLTQSKLSDLQAENQGLKLAASQAAQNSYLVSQLRPSPIPAYTVQNPYCCNQFACCGC